jgi:hypothetical protein
MARWQHCPVAIQAMRKDEAMKVICAAAFAAVALALLPTVAAAQDRLVDGALGAGAGALVGGPVGAVVGGAVGFAAGPQIAHGMGIHSRRHYRHSRHHVRRHVRHHHYADR